MITPYLKAFVITISFCVFFLHNFSSLSAQPLHKGEWRTYTAMDSITDLAVVRSSGNIWAATWGGAFRFTPSGSPKPGLLTLRNSDGLSDNNLTAVAADSNGKIYFGGANGTLDVYTESDSSFKAIRDIALATQYAQRKIYSIQVFGPRIYIATGFGLSIYDTTKNIFTETIPHFGSLNEQDTVFAAMEANDSIYAVLSGAVASAAKNAPNLSDPFAWQIVRAPSDTTLNSIVTVQGKIIVGGGEGIFILSGGALRFIHTQDSVSVVRMAVSGSTLFIIDSRNKKIVTSTDLQNFSSAPLPGDSSEQHIGAFAVANSNAKVFGFGIGAVVLQLFNGSVIPKIFPDGPLSNDIVDLHFAGSLGKLFVCIGTIGVSAFEPEASVWSGYATSDGTLQATKYTNSFYDTVHSKLWLSTFGSGLFGVASANFASVQHFGVKEGIPPFTSGDTGSFIVTGGGALDNHGNFIVTSWAGDGEGLSKTSDGKVFTSLQLNPPNGARAPYGVCVQGQDDNYYAGTINFQNPSPFGVSVIVASDGSTQNILGGSGQTIGSASVNALIEDQDESLWCGTNVGVDVVTHSSQSGKTVFHSPARRLVFTDQQIVHAIAVDGVGNKWVGTDNGVFILSADGSDSLAHFTTANSPLIDNSVMTIAIDTKNGEAYLGTPKGISRVSSIYQQGEPDYSSMYIYPNPVIEHSDDAIKVTITGLAGGSTVKIFTVGGRLVATIDGSLLGSTVTWNGRDENGKLLASGVYIAAAASPITTQYGEAKFVLIRK
jgi:hypothetical protein